MASALGGRGLTMALSLLTVPLTLNYLGAERYGFWRSRTWGSGTGS